MSVNLTRFNITNVQITHLADLPSNAELNIELECMCDQKSDSNSECKFSVNITPKDNIEISNLFKISLDLLASFDVSPDESIDNFRYEAVRLILPHLRATIASIMSSCLIPPLFIPPLNQG